MSGSSAVSVGHEITRNGFGVMMASVDKDPFIHAWIQAAAQSRPNEVALELGAAFGVASLTALRLGATQVVANDISEEHLQAVEKRWKALRAEVAACGEAPLKGRLELLHGPIPEILHSERIHHVLRNTASSEVEDVLDSKLNATTAQRETAERQQLTCILSANVLHFLSPSDIVKTGKALHNIAAPGARWYISVDSPWTKTYKPFWPWLYFKKYILRMRFPSFHRLPPLWVKKYFIPERLLGAPIYHPMEPDCLKWAVEQAGWRVCEVKLFPGDSEGNPDGVSLENGVEMTGLMAVKDGN